MLLQEDNNGKKKETTNKGTERANQILAELESCSPKELRMRLQKLANKLL
jgi:DNA-binding HxlR family transcriptional regulator